MDILGVGGWELVAILLIMLIVAGPKRMIQWSYTLGKYVAQLRRMWSETAQMLQKEFDDAGVDVQVPKDIPTRADLKPARHGWIADSEEPFQETMNATQKEIDSAKEAVRLKPTPINPPTTPAATPPAQTPPPTPTVKPIEEKPAASNGNSNGHADFGTWSQRNEGSS